MPELHPALVALLPFDRPEAPLDVTYWVELRGRIERATLVQLIEERLPYFPHAKETLLPPRGWPLAVPWEAAKGFRLDQHLFLHRLAQRGEDAALRFLAQILSRKFADQRPRWQIHCVQYGKRSILIVRHHVFWSNPEDEGAWLNALLDPQPQRRMMPPRGKPSASEQEIPPAPRVWAAASSLLTGFWRRWRAGKDVIEPLRREVDALANLARLALRPLPQFPFNGPLSGRRHAAWCSFPLTAVRTIRNRIGGSVWEILVASALGGLTEVLANKVEKLEQRTLVAVLPVAVGSEQDARRTGRRVTLAVGKLPLHCNDPVERLRSVAAQLELARVGGGSDQFARSTAMLTTLVVLGGEVILRDRLRSLAVHSYFWPFPGLREQRYVAGIPVERVVPLPPLTANLGLVFGLATSAEEALISVVGDPERACDLVSLRATIERAFAELLEVAEGRAAAQTDVKTVRG